MNDSICGFCSDAMVPTTKGRSPAGGPRIPPLDARYVSLRDPVLPGEGALRLIRCSDVRDGFRRQLRPPSTTAVLSVRNGLQVVGVDAGADTAEMIKLGPGRNRAVPFFGSKRARGQGEGCRLALGCGREQGMKRVFVTSLAALLSLAALTPVASARRPAPARAKATIVKVALGHSVPVRCARVYISTVDSTWASGQFYNGPGCSKYGSDGITILHVEHHRWVAVTAGSSFRCPIQSYPGQPHVPNRVENDLIHYPRCR
jgi:hypothetical protein